MQLNLATRIKAFAELGKLLKNYLNGKLVNTEKGIFLDKKLDAASRLNPWFDKDNILHALAGISYMLDKEKLSKWHNSYENKLLHTAKPKNIAVIMAGNIPLVNFYDFLCVLISGNKFIGKLSSNDPVLPVALADMLIDIEPSFKDNIIFTSEKLTGFDAVIATGSDNSSRYFEYYFGKYPHIIRKNRNSIAILDGKEDSASLEALGEDIFKYYGLGCRNVSALLVPANYSFNRFFEGVENRKSIIDFYKYRNNYDYYKAMFLVNKTPHLDNGFILLKEEEKIISSPLSVIYYQKYKTMANINTFIKENRDSIQCVVSSIAKLSDFDIVKNFGKSQFPELWDYPDSIDTIDFLARIN